MIYFTLGFVLGAAPLLYVVRRLFDRVQDVEDRMLVMANRPDVATAPTPVRGKVTYVDEAREVELDGKA